MIKKIKKIEFIVIYFSFVIFLNSCKETDHYDTWVQKGKNYFYYDNSGNKVKDAIRRIGNYQYCFDKEGKMVTGLYLFEGNKYFFDERGRLKRGWINDSNEYYYMNEQGKAIINEWYKDNGEWYHLDNDGKMQRNQWIGEYYVGDDGKMYMNGMYSVNGEDCYFDSNGKYDKDYLSKTVIMSWINGMIAMYANGENINDYEIKYIEIHNTDVNNIKFSYVIGDKMNVIKRKQAGGLLIDYVIGAVIDGNFMRNLNPKYDNEDYLNINNLKSNWKRLISDSSYYNLSTTNEEYMNGKREDCKKGLLLVSEPHYIKTNLSNSDLGTMKNNITSDFPLLSTVMQESLVEEALRIRKMIKGY